eukprot:TRINITY_DN12424_c0_g2_i1.p1 TRINITY_DN12424_c0_g2~~TRINITY_DN12424_c0_g2_i1.p1  ORF type:complete len:361 (-),score=38.27 TRINITY_DN12424_c0_g2_i1:91-1173(-)
MCSLAVSIFRKVVERLRRINFIENLTDSLLVSDNKGWIKAMVELLITIFKYHRISESTKERTIAAVKALMERTWDDNARKLAIRFLEITKSGPKSVPPREWATPDTQLADTLFKLNLPEVLSKNEAAEKFPDTAPIDNLKILIEPDSKQCSNTSKAVNGIAHIPEVSLLQKGSKLSAGVQIGGLEMRQANLIRARFKSNTRTAQEVSVNSEKPILAKDGHKFICYTAETKSGLKQELRLPFISDARKIDASQYAGHEDLLYAKYMDTDYTDKTSPDSKAVRNVLGIGSIEASGLKKSTEKHTLRQLVDWYVAAKDFAKFFSVLLYGIISSKRAEKIMCILHLIATQKLNRRVYNPYIASQ